MGRIQHAAMHGILHLTGLDHRVDGQQVDLEVFAGPGIDPVDVRFGVLQEDPATPGGLHLQDLGLGKGHHGKTEGCGADSTDGTGLQELAAAALGLGRYFVFLGHFDSSLTGLTWNAPGHHDTCGPHVITR